MNLIIKQRQWLYLLAALLLLMQSFAIWHDASHPFHLASDQCQLFESVSHTPALPLVAPILSQLISQYSITEPFITSTYASKRLRDSHGIRAPPCFS